MRKIKIKEKNTIYESNTKKVNGKVPHQLL